MPPRLYSRHSFTAAYVDPTTGSQALTEREPFPFVDLPDNTTHIVEKGETLWGLAARYFASLPRPAGLWWIIADFQDPPIFDPTIVLEAGTPLIIPSIRTVVTDIFASSRQAEATL